MEQPSPLMAVAGQPLEVHAAGQVWLSTWHLPDAPVPDGNRHGSSGLCITEDGLVVLVSQSGTIWDLPAGRPEGDEDWRQTLDREVLEEACCTVANATLLGYGRGECILGHELGLVLVRSHWLAYVIVHDWAPQYEMPYREIMPSDEALARFQAQSDPFMPFIRRVFHDAGLA